MACCVPWVTKNQTQQLNNKNRQDWGKEMEGLRGVLCSLWPSLCFMILVNHVAICLGKKASKPFVLCRLILDQMCPMGYYWGQQTMGLLWALQVGTGWPPVRDAVVSCIKQDPLRSTSPTPSFWYMVLTWCFDIWSRLESAMALIRKF